MKKIMAAFLLLPSLCLGAINHLIAVKTVVQDLSTRYEFTLTEPSAYHVTILDHPHRLAIDFPETDLQTSLFQLRNALTPDVQFIKRPGDLRLVLYTPLPVKYQDAFSGRTLSLDVYGEPMLRNAIVVIDPGHGGKDPGAIGPSGWMEKNVVLAIAHRLQDDLNREPGIQAILTRKRDTFIPLRERLVKARAEKADVFIAIHADAYLNPNARGASVFVLSERGASSEAARWIAEKENAVELMNGVELAGKDDLLRSVLFDLTQTATIVKSTALAEDSLIQLKTVTSLHRGAVEEAPFAVLKSPDIPSILVETGFLSTPEQERLLASTPFQEKIAAALSKAVQYYFYQYPPRDSFLMLKRYGITHYTVQAGDTLSLLAKRFHTRVFVIQRLNQLSSNAIQVGRVLKMPK